MRDSEDAQDLIKSRVQELGRKVITLKKPHMMASLGAAVLAKESVG
jgi:activator of 2-hydroxyglutaryl-CoA dehydratase